MSKRKPHNFKARMDRACRSLLRLHKLAVVNLDPSGLQRMISMTNCGVCRNRQAADALCDIPHRWTVFVAGICVNWNGEEYIKGLEFSPDGVHLAGGLTELIEHFYKEVQKSCNPNHRVGMAWLAVPDVVSIDEADAARIFAAVGAWNQQKAVA